MSCWSLPATTEEESLVSRLSAAFGGGEEVTSELTAVPLSQCSQPLRRVQESHPLGTPFDGPPSDSLQVAESKRVGEFQMLARGRGRNPLSIAPSRSRHHRGTSRTPHLGGCLGGESAWAPDPVYACIRGRGHEPVEARDLTQSFFTDLIARKAMKAVDSRKGRASRRLYDRAAKPLITRSVKLTMPTTEPFSSTGARDTSKRVNKRAQYWICMSASTAITGLHITS